MADEHRAAGPRAVRPHGQRPRRLWLVALLVAAAVSGAAYSWHQRAAAPSPPVITMGGRPKLLDFGMGVCDQCKRMKPVMERAARELEGCVDVHVLDIRHEASERLAERYEMRTMPLVVLVDPSGKPLWRSDGVVEYPELLRAVRRGLEATGQPCAEDAP